MNFMQIYKMFLSVKILRNFLVWFFGEMKPVQTFKYVPASSHQNVMMKEQNSFFIELSP